MKLIYVAGPFRASNAWAIEQNIRRAEELALEVWRAGFACVCPHSNTIFYQGVLPNETWLLGDLEIVRRCDGVILAPGWEHSEGSRGEILEAQKNNIPVFHHILELRNYAGSNWIVPRSFAACYTGADCKSMSIANEVP